MLARQAVGASILVEGPNRTQICSKCSSFCNHLSSVPPHIRILLSARSPVSVLSKFSGYSEEHGRNLPSALQKKNVTDSDLFLSILGDCCGRGSDAGYKHPSGPLHGADGQRSSRDSAPAPPRGHCAAPGGRPAGRRWGGMLNLPEFFASKKRY